LGVSQEGQITERFTRAIDQLGSGGHEIIIGGIFALERIAKDSTKDYWPIMEVLTAYVRENSKAKLAESPEEQEQFDKSALSPKPIEAPIEAILNVVSRRLPQGHHEELNLSGSYLCHSKFNKAMLMGAIFTDADLRRTSFQSCHLEGTKFSGSYLHGAEFNSYLDGAIMCHIRGQDVRFSFSRMTRANLNGAILWHSFFIETCLVNANLQDSNLFNCDLTDASLVNAKLNGSVIKGSNFTGTDLYEAILIDVKFKDVVGLTSEQIETAIIDRATELPDDIIVSAEWYEEQIERSDEWLVMKYQEE
jgi:uncharacterized protein YjbI with pentapeptide repeats